MDNKNFSISRLGHILRRDISHNYKSLGQSLLCGIGIPAFSIFWVSYQTYSRSEYLQYYNEDPLYSTTIPVFIVCMIIVTCYSASLMFSSLKNKSGRIDNLLLPASQLEKYISSFTIYILIIPALIVLGLCIINVLRVAIFSSLYPDWAPLITKAFRFLDTDETKLLAAFVIAATSLFALGSAIWPKRSAVKTFAALFVIGNVLSLTATIFYKIMINPEMSYGMDDNISGGAGVDILLACSIIFALINYTIAYFRYKEIEIVQRW